MRKFLLIIFAVLLIFILLKSKETADIPKDADIAPEQVSQEEDIRQEVQSFSISGFSEDGKSRWQVEGESADIFSDVVNMRTIKARSDGKEISVTLTADEGTLFKSSKDIELRKNVIANTDEGTTLKTEKLKWLATAERIVSDEYVYVERENMSVSGTGAKAAPDMKKVWLNQGIKMIINPHTNCIKPGEKQIGVGVKPETVITCDGPMEIDYQNNISYFNKNVIIKNKEGEILADKIIAYIDPKQKRVYKAIAKGNVKIIHQQNISYSEEAIYLADEGKTILIGRPKVVIYSVDKVFEGKGEEIGESL